MSERIEEPATVDMSDARAAFEAYRASLQRYALANGKPNYCIPVEWPFLDVQTQNAWLDVALTLANRNGK
jgi:hypothetical protein